MQTDALSKNFSQTKFFSVLMKDIINGDPDGQSQEKTSCTPVLSTKTPASLPVYKNVEHLKYILSEVERRRLYAILCMTPEKIVNSSASSLANIVSQLTGIADKIKDDIIYTERKFPQVENNKKKELTNEERTRIEKLIKK